MSGIRPASFIATALVLALARGAQAGMPSIHLTEVGQVRLSVVSFFLFGLILSAVAIRLIWNWLASDFTWLPRLTFAKACALVTLWGVLFVVVLTMISGARELMTPGAWRKTGFTYQLSYDAEKPAVVVDADAILARQMQQRRAKLERLSAALQRYAAAHEGKFPDTLQTLDSAESWHVPGFPGTPYLLLPGADATSEPQPLAHEPDVFDDDPLVLLTSGEIVQRPLPSPAVTEDE